MFGQPRASRLPKTILAVAALALLTFALPSGMAASGDDANTGNYGYVWVDQVNGVSVYDWEVGASPVSIAAGSSYRTANLPAGFDFELYGNTFSGTSTYWFTEDGHIALSNPAGAAGTNNVQDMPATAVANNVIAPLWTNHFATCIAYDDSAYPNGAARDLDMGLITSGPDRLVISYTEWPVSPIYTGRNDVCKNFNTFGMKLFDGTDIGEFHYEAADNYQCGHSSQAAAGCTGVQWWSDLAVGIEDGSGSKGLIMDFVDDGTIVTYKNDAYRWFVNDLDNAISDVWVVDQDTSNNPIQISNNDDPVVYHSFATPANGALANAPTDTVYGEVANVDYTPNSAFTGTDSFTFKVDDGYDATITATKTIHVNAAPEAVDESFIVDWNTVDNALDVLANDSDSFWTKWDGAVTTSSPKVSQILNGPANGVATVAADGLSILFTPAGNWYGNVTIEYEITDGRLTDTATATIAVNAPPALTGDGWIVSEGSSANSLDVLSNDGDDFWSIDEGATDQTELDLVSVTVPDYGTAAINADKVEYTPPAGYTGPANFMYTATDGRIEKLTQVIVHVNAAPKATPNTYVVSPGSSDNSLTPMSDDTDAYWNEDDQELGTAPTAIATVSGNTLGVATISLDGTEILYTPNAGAFGADTLEYTVTDGLMASTPAEITVQINAAPTPADDSLSVLSGTLATLDVLPGDTDAYFGNALTIESVTQPTVGTVSIAPDGKSLLYQTASGDEGIFDFTYTVTDGYATGTANVRVTVKAGLALVCDQFDVTQGAVDAPLDVLDNDPGGNAGAITITAIQGGRYGTATTDGSMVFYSPSAADFAGPDRLVYTATDGKTSAECNIDLTVLGPAPSYPIVWPRETAEVLEGDSIAFTREHLYLTDDIATASEIVFTITGNFDHGALIKGTTGLVTGDTFTVQDILDGTLLYHHDGGEDYWDYLAFQFTDGTTIDSETLFVEIIPVNDAPYMLQGTELVTDIDAVTVVTTDHLRIRDNDNALGELSFEVDSAPAVGFLQLDGNNLAVGDLFTYSELATGRVQLAHAGLDGLFSIQLIPHDDDAAGVPGMLSITVLPPNQLPELVFEPKELKVNQGSSSRLTSKNVLATDPDGDDMKLLYELYENPLFGRLEHNATMLHPGQSFTHEDLLSGYIIYRQNGAFAHTDAILVRVMDVRADIVGPFVVPVAIATTMNAPPDSDPDGDNIGAWQDNCGVSTNNHQADSDSDGLGDDCDPTPEPAPEPEPVVVNKDPVKIPELEALEDVSDLDRDGVPDRTDNCASISNTQQRDIDGDGRGDVCDADADGDGIRQMPAASHMPTDNCPFTFNPDQLDSDGDGVGDACDTNDLKVKDTTESKNNEATVDFLTDDAAVAPKADRSGMPVGAVIGGIGAMIVLVGLITAWGLTRKN